ncbi:hypothetical protein ACLOJK_031678 [Asimina triloba]
MNDCRDEDCEKVCCDKENEVASETLQLNGKEFFDVPKNLVDETKNILVENRLQGNLAMGYSSDQEEGELTGSMGKEKAYDAEGADRSVAGKSKNMSSDKTVFGRVDVILKALEERQEILENQLRLEYTEDVEMEGCVYN